MSTVNVLLYQKRVMSEAEGATDNTCTTFATNQGLDTNSIKVYEANSASNPNYVSELTLCTGDVDDCDYNVILLGDTGDTGMLYQLSISNFPNTGRYLSVKYEYNGYLYDWYKKETLKREKQ